MSGVHTNLFINGSWTESVGGKTLSVLDPATGNIVGTASHAGLRDLENAVDASAAGFKVWRRVAAFERSKKMRLAANVLRGQVESVARTLTLEEGKPLVEARAEVMGAADVIDWFAEEARRTYGTVIPARAEGV